MSPINLKTEEEILSAITERKILNVREMLMKASLKRLLYTLSLNLSNLRPICIWQNIIHLILWKCDISFLPMELGLFPFLKAISLSQNHLAQSKWTWLEQATIKKNLIYLNIGGNSLTKLPLQIVQLNSLICLIACDNKLRHIPPRIGCLKSLEYLLLQCNNLLYLPATLKYLQLKCLDISVNLFTLFNPNNNFKNNLEATPTLMEWSADIILKFGIQYNTSVIPRKLVTYLDEANYCCICKEACIDSYIKQHVRIHYCTSNVLAKMVMGEPGDFINIECYFCSEVCHKNKDTFFSTYICFQLVLRYQID